MVRVIIVDDEKNVLELINFQLSDMNQFKVLATYTNPLEAYEAIISLKPELVISDIEMPGLTGVELAKKVLAKAPEIYFVFLTAYKQYAIDAFNVYAVHYLLKPVSKKDLKEVYDRIRNIRGEKNNISDKKIEITTFGDFSVINSKDVRVKFSTKKEEELFALLIMNRSHGVGKWKLINELWDISDIKKPLQNLYTTVYRLKKTFEKYELPYDIEKKNDHYSIKLRNTFYDYEEFNLNFKKSKTLEISKENLVQFKNLINLVSGDLFMYKDYIWCIYERNGLNSNYEFILKKMRDFYKEHKMQEELLEINQLIEKNNNNI